MKKIMPLFLVVFLALFWNVPVAMSVSTFSPTDPKMSDYYKVPSFISSAEEPSTMIILDSSGSMRTPAYRDNVGVKRRYGDSCEAVYIAFDSIKKYYGYFDNTSYYSWDEPNDYFEKCVAASGVDCNEANAPWSGNFLNWLIMRRVDVAKKVLSGGKVDADPTVLVPFNTSLGYVTRRVYDDRNQVADINGDVRHMTPYHERLYVYQSIDDGYQNMAVSGVSSIDTSCDDTDTWNVDTGNKRFDEHVRIKVHANDLVDGTVEGLIQKNSAKIRFGLTIFDTAGDDVGETSDDSKWNGGEVVVPIGSSETNVVNAINNAPANANTPVAETLYTVAGNFQQEATIDITNGPRYAIDSYSISGESDPFWFGSTKGYVSCSKAFVILITDGEPTRDGMIESDVRTAGSTSPHNNTAGLLENVAFWAHTTDLRADLDGTQSIVLYAVYAFGSGTQLRDAAINGSFQDKNGDGLPNSWAAEAAADLENKEWDFNNDNIPDHYAEADDGAKLEEALGAAMNDIIRQLSSGTATSVISSSRSGEGAAFQAIFVPSYVDRLNHEISWMGELHALFKDKAGNFREDTDRNGQLDYKEDRVVQIFFDDDLMRTRARLYKDLDGDGTLDSGEDVDGDIVRHQELGLDDCDHHEDKDYDGHIDIKEDKNGNGRLDRHEDLNGNGIQDPEDIDLNGDGGFDKVYEDLDGDCVLDSGEDYDGDGRLDVGEDVDCDGKLDLYDEDVDGDGKLDGEEDLDQDGVCDVEEMKTIDATVDLLNVKFLWSAGKQLGAKSDAETQTQGTYKLDLTWDKKRTILTSFDTNGDGWIQPSEVKEFTSSGTGDSISAVNNIYTYFHLPLSDPADATASEKAFDYDNDGDTTEDFDDLKMLINYIRGTEYSVFRSREIWFDDDNNGSDETKYTWRLGDIVEASPISVAAPAENFDLLYKDHSYRKFAKKYRKRRHVLYVGSNDGMLHAINGGFYDKYIKKVWRNRNVDFDPYDNNTSNDVEYVDSGPQLGDELWAYIPYNALPHLQWLPRKDYTHVYFVDKQPRVADVKIFAEEGACTTAGVYDKDCVHPGGWGTILIGGMRFGGGPIAVDSNDDDTIDNTDEILSSSYFVLDITNPEQKPTLLGEFSFDALDRIAGDDFSFTTSNPTIIQMKNRANTDTGIDWYLTFGTGPTTLRGQSDQNGRIYIMKMNYDPVTNGLGSWVDNAAGADIWFAEISENESFISDLISADFEIGDNTGAFMDDAIYFGSVSGGFKEDPGEDFDNDNVVDTGWSGNLYRIILNDNIDSANWRFGTTSTVGEPFLAVGKPIVAAPNISTDKKGNVWIYAGTGRFFDRLDALDQTHQQIIGAMEPLKWDGTPTKLMLSGEDVDMADLLDTSLAKIYKGTFSGDSVVTGVTELESIDPAHFSDLMALFDNDPDENKKLGWKKEVLQATTERIVSSPIVFGGGVFTSSYAPELQVCSNEGRNWIYALYYLTGTAYFKSIFGDDPGDTFEEQPLSINFVGGGPGRPGRPVIDDPGGGGNTTLNTQSSTGEIQQFEPDTPIKTDDGRIYWKNEL